jgi:hypothetical protein
LLRAGLALLASDTIAPISIVYSKISRKCAEPFADGDAGDREEQKSGASVDTEQRLKVSSPAQANRKAVRMTSLVSNRRQLICAEGIDSYDLPGAKLGNLGMTESRGEWWR